MDSCDCSDFSDCGVVACSSLKVGWTCLRIGLDAWVVVNSNSDKDNKEHEMERDCIFVYLLFCGA